MRKLMVVVAFLFLFGCEMMPVSEMSKEVDFATLAKNAQSTLNKADSVGGEWRDSEKLIKKAQAAAKKGDMGKAVKLAKKAEKQGQLGFQQANDQANAGPWLF